MGTSEAADGPGIEDDILGLKAQAVDGKLDHHIHGVGLILWERHPLQEEGNCSSEQTIQRAIILLNGIDSCQWH